MDWLEELSQNPQISDIIPGVIQVNRSPERGIVYKYETQTGCKILLKSNGSIQEAFVVTQEPEFVRQWVEAQFPSDNKSSSNQPETADGKKIPSVKEKHDKGNLKQRSRKKAVSDKSSFNKNNLHSKKSSLSEKKIERIYVNNEDFEGNLGQRIDAKTHQALKALQKDLKMNKGKDKKN
ncbi:DUF2103 domain-containing protein [Desulfitobacterium dichloroeliminans]|uniref:DUF2103 domain-containing protein n=1 Tax=Desulfitobacterium dichloroeliminans TaxID=233055 RepID=UPI001FA7DC96